jgi:uroporphyrin-III C-methyltransferase
MKQVDGFGIARQPNVSSHGGLGTAGRSAGRVVLVGAGPGGADLITLRGARALARADAVVYDRLADPELLDLAPASAARYPVGKGKGFGATQADINQLLVDLAAAGQQVVRLKGGDPFVFGRGQEEIDAVQAAGYDVEVVPGVTSAIGGLALAGIPVTDRRHAASFTVITGHRAAANLDAETVERWRCLAASGETVVALMAASTAAATALRLLDGGRPATELVAFVHAAGTADQAVARTSLADAAANGCPFPAPTLMVVGAVAALAEAAVAEAAMPGSANSARS